MARACPCAPKSGTDASARTRGGQSGHHLERQTSRRNRLKASDFGAISYLAAVESVAQTEPYTHALCRIQERGASQLHLRGSTDAKPQSGVRCKRAGMHWIVTGTDAIVILRCFVLSAAGSDEQVHLTILSATVP